MVDEEGYLEPYTLSQEDEGIQPEDIEELKIKTYATEVEAWQNPAQIVFSDKVVDRAYYHPPTQGDPSTPIVHFVALPKKGSTRSKEGFLKHEFAHEKFRHSASDDPLIRVVNEIEAILDTRGSHRNYRWPQVDKNYFLELLLFLPTEEERRLAIQAGSVKGNFNGPIPWPYETEKGAVPGWIHTEIVADDDAFEEMMFATAQNLEGENYKLKRSKGRRRIK